MIYYIYGTDDYLVRQKTEEIKSGFVNKRDKGGFNVIRLSAENMDCDRFMQEVLTVPFLSEKKLIIIDNLCASNQAGQKKSKDDTTGNPSTGKPTGQKKVRDDIFEFLKSREDKIENSLLFVDIFADEKKLPEKDKLFNYLRKQQYSWNLAAPQNNDLATWIKNYCTRQAIKITAPAINELLLLVGNDLSQMSNELDKLKSYRAGEPILAEDVRVLVKAKYDNNIFKLTDAMANRNRRLAMELVSQQLLSGNEPLSLLGSINWQFKILFKIKSILEADPNKSSGNIASQIGAHPYVVSKNMTAVKKFTTAELISILNDLLKIEIKLKSTSRNPELLFDLFISKNS